MRNLSYHLALDLIQCRRVQALTDLSEANRLASMLVKQLRVTELFRQAKSFGPPYNGYSLVLVLAESHIAIHTWPEHEAVTLDLHVCGSTLQLELETVTGIVAGFFLGRPQLRQLTPRGQVT